MKYFEDDSHTIPEYIKKMSREELQVFITKLEAKELKKRAKREAKKLRADGKKTKPINA
jgi:hypothetical protein